MYKCVHCSRLYDDGSSQVLTGCDSCKGKFFFYMKNEQLNKAKQKEVEDVELSAVEKEQIERDVRDIAGIEDEEIPVFLDFESVKIIKPGKYVVDLANLFSTNKPRVYKMEDGKYVVDLFSIGKSAKEGSS